MDMLDAMGFSADQIAGALSSLPESEAGNVERILDVLLNNSNLIDSNAITMPPAPPIAAIEGHVVHLGISQFDYGTPGSSACTSISLRGILVLIRQFNEKNTEALSDENILTMSLLQAIEEGVSCMGDSSDHQNVEEVWLTLSDSSTDIHYLDDQTVQGLLKVNKQDAFVDLIEKIDSLLADGSRVSVVGVAFTKQPLTIVIMAFKTAEGLSYVLFDSHSRPEIGVQSAWYSYSLKRSSLVNNLQLLFPRMSNQEEELAVELLYHSYEAHFFVPSLR